jgi:hypothetical protein
VAVDPKHDFRYIDEAGVEVEAYKVTKGARWAAHDWPSWLQTQSSVKDVNKVYTDPSDPNRLFINLPEGRFGIEDDAYVVYEGGAIRVQGGEDFERTFGKVVPVPPRNLDEPSLPGFEQTHSVVDGKLIALDPVINDPQAIAAQAEVVSPSEAAEYRGCDYGDDEPNPIDEALNAIKDAILMLQEREGEEALKLLKDGLTARTKWCDCVPGQCADKETWSCRQKSPLVK